MGGTRQGLLDAANAETGRSVRVITGVSAEGSLEGIDHALATKAAGADAILLMPPHHWLRFGRKSETRLDSFRTLPKALTFRSSFIISVMDKGGILARRDAEDGQASPNQNDQDGDAQSSSLALGLRTTESRGAAGDHRHLPLMPKGRVKR